jgi:hypothetical protein
MCGRARELMFEIERKRFQSESRELSRSLVGRTPANNTKNVGRNPGQVIIYKALKF